MPASTNLFFARSWPIPPYGNEIRIPAFIKLEEKPDTENAPLKQAVIPCPMVLGISIQNNKSSEELCGWGLQCHICVQSASKLKTEDFKKDWNGDRQKAMEEEK